MRMNKQDFLNRVEELIRRGYIPVIQDRNCPKEDGSEYLYKVIDRDKDSYGDMRAVNQLLYKIWHLENYRHRIESDQLYSLEPVVDFSRNTSERIELHLSWPELSIDECEGIARKFGEWAKENIPEKLEDV